MEASCQKYRTYLSKTNQKLLGTCLDTVDKAVKKWQEKLPAIYIFAVKDMSSLDDAFQCKVHSALITALTAIKPLKSSMDGFTSFLPNVPLDWRLSILKMRTCIVELEYFIDGFSHIVFNIKESTAKDHIKSLKNFFPALDKNKECSVSSSPKHIFTKKEEEKL